MKTLFCRGMVGFFVGKSVGKYTMDSLHLSRDQNPGYLLYTGDDILSSYIGIQKSHYKDPYQPSSITECH